MTMRAPEADPLFLMPAPRRPAYATGMLLDAEDFADEQTYHRGRLARAVWALGGGGTLAGLRVSHRAAGEDRQEEIRVGGGLAADRLGRLVEVSRTACLRLGAWWESTLARDEGGTLTRSAYSDPARFISARAVDAAGSDDRPAIPERAVVADVFVRFVSCEAGLTPVFASGPLDALDAASVSRLRDGYELLLVAREGLDDDFDGLPVTGEPLPDDPGQRRAAIEDEVLAAWPSGGLAGRPDALPPLPEHPVGLDVTAQFLGRILLPVSADSPPARDGEGVVVDNWSRRFVPSIALLQRQIGT